MYDLDKTQDMQSTNTAIGLQTRDVTQSHLRRIHSNLVNAAVADIGHKFKIVKRARFPQTVYNCCLPAVV